MDTKTFFVGSGMLAVGLAAGFLFADGGRWDRGASGMHQMGDGSMMVQDIDRHFIAQMIPHHEGAIQMAKAALNRSTRTEITTLANDIIIAQAREIEQMRAWHTAWFESPVSEDASHMHMDGMTGDTDALQTVSDTEFGREFINQMIPHHEMAVMMASMLKASTERKEMKELAEAIITSQSREIEMMRGWLDAWY